MNETNANNAAPAKDAGVVVLRAASFGEALEWLKRGARVRRAGWNGKGMFLFLIAKWSYTDGRQDNFPNLPFIAMKTADDKVVPWLCSQTDALAADWEVMVDGAGAPAAVQRKPRKPRGGVVMGGTVAPGASVPNRILQTAKDPEPYRPEGYGSGGVDGGGMPLGGQSV